MFLGIDKSLQDSYKSFLRENGVQDAPDLQSTVASSGNSRRSYDSRRSGGSYGHDEKESHKIFDVRNVKLENIRLEQHGRAVHVKVSQELDERRNNGCSERRVTYIHELPRSAIPSTVRHSYDPIRGQLRVDWQLEAVAMDSGFGFQNYQPAGTRYAGNNIYGNNPYFTNLPSSSQMQHVRLPTASNQPMHKFQTTPIEGNHQPRSLTRASRDAREQRGFSPLVSKDSQMSNTSRGPSNDSRFGNESLITQLTNDAFLNDSSNFSIKSRIQSFSPARTELSQKLDLNPNSRSNSVKRPGSRNVSLQKSMNLDQNLDQTLDQNPTLNSNEPSHQILIENQNNVPGSAFNLSKVHPLKLDRPGSRAKSRLTTESTSGIGSNEDSESEKVSEVNPEVKKSIHDSQFEAPDIVPIRTISAKVINSSSEYKNQMAEELSIELFQQLDQLKIREQNLEAKSQQILRPKTPADSRPNSQLGWPKPPSVDQFVRPKTPGDDEFGRPKTPFIQATIIQTPSEFQPKNCCLEFIEKHKITEKMKTKKLEKRVSELEDSLESKNQQIIYLVKDTQKCDVELKKEKSEHDKLKKEVDGFQVQFKLACEDIKSLNMKIGSKDKIQAELKLEFEKQERNLNEKCKENKRLIGKLTGLETMERVRLEKEKADRKRVDKELKEKYERDGIKKEKISKTVDEDSSLSTVQQIREMVADLKRDFASQNESKPAKITKTTEMAKSQSSIFEASQVQQKRPSSSFSNQIQSSQFQQSAQQPTSYPTVKNRANLINTSHSFSKLSQSMSNLSTPIEHDSIVSPRKTPKLYPKPQLGGRSLPKQVIGSQKVGGSKPPKALPVMYVRFNSTENVNQRYSSLESINEY